MCKEASKQWAGYIHDRKIKKRETYRTVSWKRVTIKQVAHKQADKLMAVRMCNECMKKEDLGEY